MLTQHLLSVFICNIIKRAFVSSVIEVKMSDGVMLRVKYFIRGYHEYMDIWVPNVEDKYRFKQEQENKKDPNAVAIVRPGQREENHLGKTMKF